ncbi:hypothetical protein CLAFUW4_11713 [Fulvia fulva]|uniref:Uncharacterized protein n=1 Tax=Passalora fulva TaxID=5499 RepID=A0A9Q8PC26_PASFU|nr:uncharacterized protein CLAFUR5_10758 [Fulvia fulva]KAK4619576.1 hypothetical protein CLAFUR4_11718 [Fulvia fulva]KAK4620758.1 hypothetical protein CLAFUR0_11731 [Fulvia fulva]UJO19799.1 hypothetical protein CLAFUR5_10758 [Fulvia fulva]WPV17025.1 hypothetical protein CLAFUW4_11713 [Fulvia fulva]WPV32583.1 hypothetical protein CLAFUW7_11721 [Fulvia fulva]
MSNTAFRLEAPSAVARPSMPLFMSRVAQLISLLGKHLAIQAGAWGVCSRTSRDQRDPDAISKYGHKVDPIAWGASGPVTLTFPPTSTRNCLIC